MNTKKKYFIKFVVLFISLIFISTSFINCIKYDSDFTTLFTLSDLFWKKNNVVFYEELNAFYPHSFYILFYFFTLFKFEVAKIIFFFLNLFFLTLSIRIVIKNYNLSFVQSQFLILISFTSTPFTNALAIGNLSLIILFFILSYFFLNSKLFKSFFLFLAFIKYNLSFMFILNSILIKEYKVLFYFFLYNLASVFFYFYYLDMLNLTQLLNPFLASLNLMQQDVSGMKGIINGLFSVHNFLINHDLHKYYFFFFLGSVFFVILFLNKIVKNKFNRLNLLCILTTLLVYHVMYDFVILLPFLGYLIKNYKQIKFFMIHFCTVLFIFYFYRFNQLILNNLFLDKTLSDLGCLLLIVSFFLLIRENIFLKSK
jgi:hypothetical protein